MRSWIQQKNTCIGYGISFGNFFAKITSQKCMITQSAAAKVDTKGTANGGIVQNARGEVIPNETIHRCR